ncbi:MAG: hypothetical protein AB8B55_03440 [Mariniblastus sp.]
MSELDFSIIDESVESASGALSQYRNWRRDNPEAKFKQFLKQAFGSPIEIDDELLIELATTDLIHMISNGHVAKAESYIRCSKSLAGKKELVLDLIDAEICTRSDHGEPVNAKELTQRFPNLKSDLARMLEVHAIDMEASNELRLEKAQNKSFGLYDIKEKTAESDGTFEIWSAQHRESNQPFSIIRWQDGDEHTLSDIQRKFELRKNLQHCCLINIAEVGFSDHVVFVTDPIQGKPLIDWLDSPTEKSIDEATAVRWISNILEARQMLVQGLNHRFSISIGDLFVTPDDQPILLDSPLQFDPYRHEPSFESVLQSVGLLIFAICLRDTDVEKIRDHLDEGFDPIMINDVNEDISTGLNSIYLSCLHPKPKQRYRNVDEVIVDLKNFQTGKPLKATKLQRKWF